MVARRMNPHTHNFDQNRVLVMVLAGGEGRRLFPLTLDRAKPAVPFGVRYRIIDIVLSNFVNSVPDYNPNHPRQRRGFEHLEVLEWVRGRRHKKRPSDVLRES